MKTIHKLCIAATVLLIYTGCELQEPHTFLFEEEAINFYTTEEQAETDPVLPEQAYPSYLTQSVSPNTWDNHEDGVTEITVDFSVQTQGFIRDFDRRVVLVATETTDWQAPLPVTELIIPAGESLLVYDQIPIDHVPFGRMTTWVVGFDYEQSDFVAGSIERQSRTITIDNRYTISSVNLSAGYWEAYLQGSSQSPGFGTWSNIKAMFIVETLGVNDFFSLCQIAFATPAEFALLVQQVAERLEEYKILSTADPETYPPLLDDELNDGSWIEFNY